MTLQIALIPRVGKAYTLSSDSVYKSIHFTTKNSQFYTTLRTVINVNL